MNLNFKLIITILLVTVQSTFAAVNGKCTGRSGICIDTGTCSSRGGTSYSGYCPSDAGNIRCCDNIPCQANDGRSGRCVFSDQCGGDKISGKCPGGSDFKCCVGSPSSSNYIGASCSYDGISGSCQYDNNCSGFQVSGKCAGPSNIKCCLPKRSCTGNNGASGTCLPTDQCGTGYTEAGHCSGGSSIKCCLPKPSSVGVSCSYDGLNGTCQYDYNCGSGFQVSGKCPGASNIKCCIPKATCRGNDGSSGVCLPSDQCNTGYTEAGHCSGGSTIKCCLPKPNPVGTSCTYDGVSGTCQYDYNCNGGFQISGKCPGASNIKCCIPKRTCTGNDGSSGVCLPTDQCNTGYTEAGHCSGGSTIKCCLPKPNPVGGDCSYDGLSGTCQYDYNCNGGFQVSGKCPGASNIKCCIPKRTCTGNDGSSGVCLPTDQCDTGYTEAGHCSGGSTIKCCLKKKTEQPSQTSCEYQGLTGVCKNVNECNSNSSTFTVDGRCPQFGNDIKCCLPRRACDDGNGQCITEKQCGIDGGSSVSGKCMSYGGGIKCCVKGNPSTTPSNPSTQTSCEYDGLTGVCKNVNECNSDSSTFTVDGRCPQFGNDIKCCLPRRACDDGSGQCITEKQCGIDGGTSVSRKCMSYGNDIKCCVKGNTSTTPTTPQGTCEYQGIQGNCKNVRDCNLTTSFTQDGLCPGTGTETKCCLPKTKCYSDLNEEGECIPRGKCESLGGNPINNKCPKYGNDIKCCIYNGSTSTTPSTQTPCDYEGLTGVCKNANECNSNSSTFTVDGRCPQFGNDIKCCLPRKPCDDGSGQCLTEKQCGLDGGSPVSKKCMSYGNDIKCCVKGNTSTTPTTPQGTCEYQGIQGNCKSVRDCNLTTSFTQDGLCGTGNSDIKCCLPKTKCYSDLNEEGECIPKGKCINLGGNPINNKCPKYGNDIKCCIYGGSKPIVPTNPTDPNLPNCELLEKVVYMSNEKIIWDELKSTLNNNDIGLAGLMGSLYAESKLRPGSLQHKKGETDEELMKRSAAYVEKYDKLSKTMDNKKQFINEGLGFGLAQWTDSDRKGKLFNFAKNNGKSLGDLYMQIDYIKYELNNSEGRAANALRSAGDINEASLAALQKYERPSTQYDKNEQDKRYCFSMHYYNKYAGSSSTTNRTAPPNSNPPTDADPTDSDSNSNSGSNSGSTPCTSEGMITMLAHKNNYGKARSLDKIEYIAIHYTANVNDSARGNGKYFQTDLADYGKDHASAHYFVDDNVIVQSVPDDYVAYAVGGSRWSTPGGRLYGIVTNTNSLSIELCDTEGRKASATTINNGLCFLRQKMKEYGIDKDHVIRHYDVNGKPCPAYWTDDDLWREEFWNRIE